VRGQCNIYSDVTFHFYEAGKRCRSRKRAARDVPAWEAAVTSSTTRGRLQRGSGERGALLRTPRPQKPPRAGDELQALPTLAATHPSRGAKGRAGVGRTFKEQRPSPGLLGFRRCPASQEPVTQRGCPSNPRCEGTHRRPGQAAAVPGREESPRCCPGTAAALARYRPAF